MREVTFRNVVSGHEDIYFDEYVDFQKGIPVSGYKIYILIWYLDEVR